MKLHVLIFTLMIATGAIGQQSWKPAPLQLPTRWSKQVTPANALPDYPRPQMVRGNWQNLNGLWAYMVTAKGKAMPSAFGGQILVPYPIESALSGVEKPLLPDQWLWYKRTIAAPSLRKGERLLLHFGAVDWQATVYVNGKETGSHEGGYGNFTLDITVALKKDNNELVVRVYDPTDEGPNPHGKQVLHPQSIFYTPTSGIWQTVWLEKVPAQYIDHLVLTPDMDKGILHLEAVLPAGMAAEQSGLEVNIPGQAPVRLSSLEGDILIPQPHLWSPGDPYLYHFTVKLLRKGKVVDGVTSYFGMRKVEVKKDKDGMDRIFLNNKFVFNLGVLDQGFWPDGIYTAPTDEALRFDIEAIKSMGFNTIRKHIKREPDRWYYWCDTLGMIVWQDMVNPGNTTEEGKAEFEKECKENITQLHNHPCITTWTLFNEKWGQYDQERLTGWIKQLDPARLINGHSGEYLYVNDQLRSPSPDAYIASDLTDVHSYPYPRNSLQMDGKARVLGEFGGIGVFIPGHQWNSSSAWGYITETAMGLRGKYAAMNEHLELLKREGLSASIYTQPFDVEGEQNGMMTYDREVIKIPFAELRKIHSRIVPTASNLPEVAIADADATDPAVRYSTMLQEYVDGKRAPAFLQELAQMATQVGDKDGAERAGKDLIATLHDPLSPGDIRLVSQFTSSTKDPGFDLMVRDSTAFKKELGDRKYVTSMMNMIYNGEMKDIIEASDTPDWDAVSALTKHFGAPGEEILLRAETIYFFNKHDWDAYRRVAKEYLDRYGGNLRPDEKETFTKALNN